MIGFGIGLILLAAAALVGGNEEESENNTSDSQKQDEPTRTVDYDYYTSDSDYENDYVPYEPVFTDSFDCCGDSCPDSCTNISSNSSSDSYADVSSINSFSEARRAVALDSAP